MSEYRKVIYLQYEEMLKENARLIKLFESLTPGGSEFYNDPDRCYRFAKDSHSTMGKVAAERNALRAENDALREALTKIKNISSPNLSGWAASVNEVAVGALNPQD